MAKNVDSVNQRLDEANASGGGAPKVDPDQYRKYLGTFRERVSLAVKNKDLDKQHSQDAVKKELSKNNKYLLRINGQDESDLTAPYMQIAAQYGAKFDIESEGDYSTKPDGYGIIYSANNAINQSPIDVNNKYPQTSSKPKSNSVSRTKHKSLWSKIKAYFKK